MKFLRTGIGLFAICLGFLYLWLNPLSIEPREDAREYDAIAWNLASGKGFSLDGTSPTALRGPTYPGFLSIIYTAVGHNDLAVRIIQIFLHAINCWLVYAIGSVAFNDKVGIIASIFYAVYPPFIFYTGLILSETFTIFLFLSTFLLLVKAINQRSILLTVTSGVTLGLSILCKPTLLPFSAFFCLFLWLFRKTRPLLVFGFCLFVTTILTISPWVVRNYLEFHRWIPVSAYSGYNLLLGTISRDDPTFEIDAFKNEYYQNPIEQDRVAFLRGIDNIKGNPKRYIAMMPEKLAYFLLPEGLSIIGNSHTLQGKILISFQGFLLFFALIGTIRSIHSFNTYLIVSPILYFGFIHILTISTPRFNLPIMPYVILLAAAGILSTLASVSSSLGIQQKVIV